MENDEARKPEDAVEQETLEQEEASSEQEYTAAEESEEAAGKDAEEPADEKTDAEKLEQAQADLKKMEEVYDSLLKKYLSLTVEYENFRKRSQKEKEAVYPDAVASTVEKFLQVVDNFERAMEFETQDKEYKKGVDLIYSSLMDTLSKLQVEAYAEVGDAFQPEIHNAVMHIEDENFEENVVSQVFQKGYKIGGKVVRHAMVQVAN